MSALHHRRALCAMGHFQRPTDPTIPSLPYGVAHQPLPDTRRIDF
ncbi:hypothetical protein [uncultured Kushneria sp.]|nr:hypothetical protein [uncultured Kushneria sp.]